MAVNTGSKHHLTPDVQNKLQAHARCDHMLFARCQITELEDGGLEEEEEDEMEEERGEEREGNDDSQ